ncbi:bifunctional 2-dehydro-3-deoxygluconokinase/2-dehydro-3-deoxygalactonokinase [Natronomonas sp. EA1]|uniref:bifunctional 2-dehydro-3-deoxygluconokinase/2-dehydro-3- deoxygalactonokinase n=1 Tax=Natronomonas sp. EA1 TaxID=3421655 RepID=UPI003EBF5230
MTDTRDDATTELATFGETMLRLAPPAGIRLETATDLSFRTAGAESNVAIAAARLGTDATWLSKLPDSPLGRRVLADTRRHGVENAVVMADEGRVGTYYLDFGGEPRGTEVVYDRANAAVTTATPEELDLDPVREAEVFYTSGITPALSETLAATTERLLETAVEAGTTTAFDLNYRAKLWDHETAKATCEGLFPHVDVLVVAERDARAVLEESGDAAAIGRSLADAHGFETVVVTRGAEGALAVHEGTVYDRPAFETETLDPVGTGDAFVGAFLASRIDGDDIERALAAGAAAAALKRTIQGDLAVITPAELERVIAEEGGGIGR